MNIRESIHFKEGYYKINREERNLAAIFYHTLLLGNNLKVFLNKIGCNYPIIENEVGIYFEYAFIRDIWNSINNGNDFKRKMILDILQPVNGKEVEQMSVYNFNKYFGAVPKPSEKEIQSPGNWSIKHYHKYIHDNDEFLKVCKFKWSFNAKPDIVIHTTHNHAICIEAKFESKEGKYPSDKLEKEIFDKRELHSVGQLSIQENIMKLLGIETKFIFLVQNKSNLTTHLTLTWTEAFEKLDTSNCPFFIKEWLKRL